MSENSFSLSDAYSQFKKNIRKNSNVVLHYSAAEKEVPFMT